MADLQDVLTTVAAVTTAVETLLWVETANGLNARCLRTLPDVATSLEEAARTLREVHRERGRGVLPACRQRRLGEDPLWDPLFECDLPEGHTGPHGRSGFPGEW